jgi:membrane peptidoglycan carboxypeptidase
MDEPITRTIDGKSWHPQNYDRQYLGEITLRKAIEGSRNIPAITLAEEVGFEDLYDSFRRLGLSKATILPSASLGAFRTNTVEMAGAYAVFAGGGTITRPHLVERIADRNNETLSSNANKPMAVASNRATALATHVLRGVMTHGTGSRAKLYGAEGPVAGKTGTTDDYRDAWFTGVTPELAIAVWVGKDRGTLGLAGSRAALPIWARFAVASGTIQGDFPQPEGLETATVSHLTGLVVNDDCPHTYQELFRAGNIPPKSKSCDRDQPIVPEITRVFSQLFGRKKIRKDGDEGMNKPN